ncbi:MAG: TraB/GumN family protein [Treponema sp.]|nr:TraB/GumN family protein [Treponema sp.]
MSNNNVHLSLGRKNIHLIGTAHVSKESIEEVSNAIRGLNSGGEKPNEATPSMVCVELDQGRYSAITQQNNWERLNISKVLKEGKGFLLLANIALTSFQRRLGNELGVKPGEEMLAAISAAKELNIPFSLCDREVQLTLRRAWARCGLWSKCKLLAALLSSAFVTEKISAEEINDLKNSNELDGMMQEMANYLPAVKEVLIDERDRYLATKIWEAAETTDGITIAVIGAGHLRGIQTYLEQFSASAASGGGDAVADLAEIESIPPKSFFSKSIKWIIPALILGLLTTGFILADFNEFLEMVWHWIFWNGSLAALGCIIALGHPLAVLVSFAGAPITSLNPFIGVGILSGLVHAVLRKPRVCDAENLSSDVASIKGFYRNRISRVLLVFFLSSLGSSIATFVAGSALVGSIVDIISRLFR